MADSLNWLTDALHAVAPGLKNLVPEVGAEMQRLGTQGAMELASALFHGSAFVPYGPGQYTPTPEHSPILDATQPDHPPAAPEHGHERGGMER